MTTKTDIRPTDILNEWGEAIRGDWGSIDGRSCRAQLENLSDWINEHGNEPLTEEESIHLRGRVNICTRGGCHWGDWHESWMNCYEGEEDGV